MPGVAIITEACIDVKDRACVDVCPVQCIYEFDAEHNVLVSEAEAGSGVIETSHKPNADAIAIFGDSILYVNLDECTACTNCYQPDVCPVGAIYSEDHLPDGQPPRPNTTPPTPTRVMTTPSSSSTVATSSPTDPLRRPAASGRTPSRGRLAGR